jgi:hypothetical protein
MIKDSRPLLTFSNPADFKFFTQTDIEKLATAGGFAIAPDRLDQIVELVEQFFNRILGRAFVSSWTVKGELVRKAQKAFDQLKAAIGEIEPLLHVRSPIKSYAEIEMFLSKSHEIFEKRKDDLENRTEPLKRKLGRPHVPSARKMALEQSFAIYELILDKQPGKTKGGKAIKFVQAFFGLIKYRLAQYRFTSQPVQDRLLKVIFGYLSDASAYEALLRYRGRGPLKRHESLGNWIALFQKNLTWGGPARGNNYTSSPS